MNNEPQKHYSTESCVIFSIADILRYAPKGLTLYSTLCGPVTFLRVDVLNRINVKDKDGHEYVFGSDGRLNYADGIEEPVSTNSCLLWPAPDVLYWGDWQTHIIPKLSGQIIRDIYDDTSYIIIGGKPYTDQGMEASEYSLIRTMFAKPSEITAFKNRLANNHLVYKNGNIVPYDIPSKDGVDFVKGNYYVYTWETNEQFTNGKTYYCHKTNYIIGDDGIAYFCDPKHFRPWNISIDAKDGDILKTQFFTFIFKYIDIDGGVHYYLHYSQNDDEVAAACDTSVMGGVYTTVYSPTSDDEKADFYDHLTESNYRWDDKSRRVIYLPRFEIGDVIKHYDDDKALIILEKDDEKYLTSDGGSIIFKEQSYWTYIGKLSISVIEDE